MKFFKRAKAILGMNARNLHYVGRYNTDDSKKFADDKLYTKNFLMTRGVGTAKMYLVVKKHKELGHINPKTLPESFVIKPNRGYGGEGILVIASHKNGKFIDVNGQEHTWKDLYHHLVAILDGKYSISGLFDQAIFEELLEPHEYFNQFVEKGLPDIRIIVFNYVPIVAMLRMPTPESRGKANLHLGAVGVGIDIVTGKATYGVQYDKFVTKLPNGEKISDIHIPMWDEILTTASKAQQASQIKFLAVDIVLTKAGIKILELNARAGLGVQIANQIPLKHRLKKVEDLKVVNPEKGVEVSKALFSSVAEKDKDKKDDDHTVAGKKVIGLYEHIDVLNTSYLNIPAKIDPHSDHVVFDESLTELDAQDRYIDIVLQGERVRFPFHIQKLDGDYKAVIGGKVLTHFLIDPNLHKVVEQAPATQTSGTAKRVSEKIIKNIDKKICDIDKQLNILSFVKPLNIEEEKERFLVDPSYSPQFIYKEQGVDLEHLLREVSALPRDVDHPLAPLFVAKIDEIVSKLHFINSIGTDEFTAASESLYGRVTKQLLHNAEKYIKTHPIEEDDSKKLNTKQIVKHLEEFLSDHKLSGWKVKVIKKMTADIAINKNKNILLRHGVKFTENRIKAVIAHEIATHAYRYANGSLQAYGILSQGTANYIETEEGLAIYNQKTLRIPLGEKDHWMALRVIAVHHAKDMSFRELFHLFKTEYGQDDESAWKTTLKAKRGMTDTNKPGAFTRDIIYFKGYRAVKEYLEKHGRRGMKELYVGKIALDDVKYLEHLGEYKVKYLPEF